MEKSKIAIVYDWLDSWGGVERVLLTLAKMFPNAHFYTSFYDYKKASWTKQLTIKSSFMQNLPSIIKNKRIFSLPFFPFAFESFDFTGYKIVISVTSSFAKGVITRPETLHICYMLTSTRFLWNAETDYYYNKIVQLLSNKYKKYLKKWDIIASKRPDKIIAISRAVQNRIKKYYGRDSKIIYPPFDIQYWSKIKTKIKNKKFQANIKFNVIKPEYYLIVSRLEPYKKIDIAINAFNHMPEKQLVVVGKGSLQKKLKLMANKNILFISDILDEELSFLYTNTQALIMPQEEDFGYVSLEGQFFGCPIIAYKKGGALETVIKDKTGIFFEKQSSEAIIKTIEVFDKIKQEFKKSCFIFGPKNVEKFSKEIFIKKFKEIVLH